jgi:hypothetical protein
VFGVTTAERGYTTNSRHTGMKEGLPALWPYKGVEGKGEKLHL